MRYTPATWSVVEAMEEQSDSIVAQSRVLSQIMRLFDRLTITSVLALPMHPRLARHGYLLFPALTFIPCFTAPFATTATPIMNTLR
jgi:hypothetical protein